MMGFAGFLIFLNKKEISFSNARRKPLEFNRAGMMSYWNIFSFSINFSPFESFSLFPTKCYLELLSKVLRITFYLFKIFYPIRFFSQIPFEKWKWTCKEVSSKKWAQLSFKTSTWAQEAQATWNIENVLEIFSYELSVLSFPASTQKAV